MKNAFQNIISLIRANTEYARVAIMCDASIAIVIGILVYVGMNSANVEITNILVLSLAACFALVGIGALGYAVLYKTGYSFDYEEDE